MNLPYTLLLGDTLERMKEIPDGSVDMVLCDLPYGTTACKWDSVIPFAPLWGQYRRVCKPNAAIVLTASQPFASALVMSNTEMFAYEWVWDKGVSASFVQAKRMPMRVHENVLVFCPSGKTPTYHPQMVPKERPIVNRGRTAGGDDAIPVKSCSDLGKVYEESYPPTIQKFSCRTSGSRGLHPTQKPVALMEYLIRTYTQQGETVLDNTMGSGTTGVACVNLGRNFIGIERDESYFAIAKQRIEAAYVSPGQPTPPSKPKNNEKPQAATEEGFQQCSLF